MFEPPQSFGFLLLCRDLLLASKVLATAKAIGVAVKQVRTAEALAAEQTAAPKLIVDLNEPGFLELAGQWRRLTGGKVTAFAGHADTAAFAGARAVGLDQTLARGAFVANLESILRGQADG